MNKGRREALLAFMDIVEDSAYANLRLKELHCGEDERSFVSAWIYTSLEHIGWADYMLAHYVKRQKRVVRNIFRMAVSELFFMSTPAYAAVNEAVELTHSMGKDASASLVNAVLRRMLREKDSLPALPKEPAERLHVQYSMPLWILREWIERFGIRKAEALLSPMPPYMEIRAQYPYTTEALKSVYPQAIHGKCVPDCLLLSSGCIHADSPLFQEGKVTFQGEGAMAICRFMGDMRRKAVLDTCCAPGGKSAYLWSLCHGDIQLNCWELHPHRLQLMQETFHRLGVQAQCRQQDASLPCLDYENAFDAVLLDVPCSGLGLRQTKPDIGLHKEESDVLALVQIQQQILDTCCRYVKPGGILVYATCTISLRENEEQIQHFLREHSEFSLAAERQLLPPEDGLGGFYMARMNRCI